MKSSSLYMDRSTNQLVTEGASNDRRLLFSPDFKKNKGGIPKIARNYPENIGTLENIGTILWFKRIWPAYRLNHPINWCLFPYQQIGEIPKETILIWKTGSLRCHQTWRKLENTTCIVRWLFLLKAPCFFVDFQPAMVDDTGWDVIFGEWNEFIFVNRHFCSGGIPNRGVPND